MEDYKAASMKKTAPEKPPETKEKVINSPIKGETKIKKKSPAAKFLESFAKEDGRTIGTYIIKEILDPAIRKTIQEALSKGIDLFLWGKNGSGKPQQQSTGSFNYGGCFKQPQLLQTQKVMSSISQSYYAYNDVLIPSEAEAIAALSEMNSLMEAYKMVSVAEYYSITRVSASHTDNKYGWTDIGSAVITKVNSDGRDWWIIKLPRAVPLD